MDVAQNTEHYDSLSGTHKAAILMLSLGAENSASILGLMEHEEITELSHVMASLGTIDATTVEQLLTEFTDQMSSTGSLLGTIDSTERLLLSSLEKEKVDQIMGDLKGPEGRTMWDKLGNIDEEVLANFLKSEYPQTVAVILSRVTSEHAARVLARLPEGFALDVVSRLLRIDTVQKDILDGIEKTLRAEFMNNLSDNKQPDSHERIADIFNSLDRSTENRLMGELEKKNPKNAEKIKGLMFTFEDLLGIDSAGIQALLRKVEQDRLVVALKGTSQDIRDLFLTNMSERAGRMMEEDMEALGPVRASEVEAAQNEIISIAKELAVSGEIYISSANEDDELIF